jgi:hypothetical protein
LILYALSGKLESELDYLLNELESLGVRKQNVLESNNNNNNIHEIENLVDKIKQTYIQDYRSSYGYSN